ncbi:MAG: OmpH family outer membrane protein [Bacteroidales bacterium]
MKTFFIFLAGLFFSVVPMNAQKVGYINSETILGQIEAYSIAQNQLKDLSEQYKTIIDNEKNRIDNAYKAYQNDRARMSEAQRQQRENDIILMEKAMNEKQESYFGEDGIIAKRTDELLKPIKDKMDLAIKRVAEMNNISIIIDVAVTSGVVYKAPGADLSQQVIMQYNK